MLNSQLHTLSTCSSSLWPGWTGYQVGTLSADLQNEIIASLAKIKRFFCHDSEHETPFLRDMDGCCCCHSSTRRPTVRGAPPASRLWVNPYASARLRSSGMLLAPGEPKPSQSAVVFQTRERVTFLLQSTFKAAKFCPVR